AGVTGVVRSGYADTVNNTGAGCCVSVDSTLNGYTREQLITAGAESNLGLGCGNPLLLAVAKPGETIVDLGSGAGIDCFIAATQVQPNGRVIGVDMTPDMIQKARANAKAKGFTDAEVQFRLGEIEYLPVADNTADCVISNCVINLSSNKPQVFADVYRVLKPGGRIAISDVVERDNVTLPSVAGAPEKETLMESIVAAGFVDVKIEEKEESREVIKQWLPGSGAEDFVVSADITA
ncbi:hypothetical protein TL16_g01088, partial [Triparma laevis f. inornata]